MRVAWVVRGPVWVLMGCLAGCGPLISIDGDSDGNGSTTEAPNTTVPPPPPHTTAPPPPGTTVGPATDGGEGTTGSDATSLVFLDGKGWDSGFNGLECDPWLQDCPRGEKCMPWANDGGNTWNALRCSPIATDPDAPGDPCTAEGSGVSGIDTCELGAMCWNVDPDTLEGTCVAFCTGSPEAPVCEIGVTCSIANDGVLALCFPRCDPLLDDCAADEVCAPLDDSFVCVVDASGDMGAPGDPCEYFNVCDPGSFCAAANVVPGCMALGCCSPFCDLDVEPPLCLPGQTCQPWYPNGTAPPGYENLGACAL